MQACFPSSADSVTQWLELINMSKYNENFASANVATIPQVRALTDDKLKEMGIGLVGHRKRLLQASKELLAGGSEAAETEDVDMVEAAPDAERQGSQDTRRANSTSSIFIQSSITQPDIDEIIFCVAIVIHDRVLQGESMPAEERGAFHYFSEDNNPLYADPGSQQNNTENPKKKKREIPSEETIFHTIRSVYECARFPSECLIVSLVYMERLVVVSSVPLLVTSWRPILLAALILSQKVWDDRSLHNIDFSVFCPMFTLKEINHLEKKFLELIGYDVSVNSSLYARYYFQLRTLCKKDNREFNLKPMDPVAVATLEARGMGYTAEFKKAAANKNWQSANDIKLDKNAVMPTF